jgi:anti-sigma regulatory factor (Ser/Thr protein kinase)
MLSTMRRREPKWKIGLKGAARRAAKKRRHQRVSQARTLARSRTGPSLRPPLPFDPQPAYRVNRNLVALKTNDKKLQIRFPKNLDLINNYEETAKCFAELRLHIFEDPAYSVAIDHSLVEKASPEAVLVLIAEMVRGDTYAPRCRKSGAMPKARDVLDLIWGVGYLQHFGLRLQNPRTGSKEFLRYFTAKKTNQRMAKQLVDHFSQACQLDVDAAKALKVAIGECMTNVKLHAYPNKSDRRLIDQWWLLGYRDRISHEISFCFYDQGDSIPETIRTRIEDQIPFAKPSDAEMISKGIEGHYSKTKDAGRGSGLPTLREFIEAAKDGELLILSRKGRYFFKKGCEPEYADMGLTFPGTLIAWTLRTQN